MKSPLEQLGRTAGWVASPAFAAVAALRHARVFHPVGDLLEGTVEVAAPGGDVEELAYALRGPVLARFSGALWKRRGSHLPDVMGCALRVGDPTSGEQDLLFATIRRPWTMGFAPLTTDVDDYLANHYFAVSPFSFRGVSRRFYLRLRPLRRGGSGDDRRARLESALAEGPIGLALEAAYRPRGPWRETAIARLDRFAGRDDPLLRFDPFTTGRGIEPRGVIHALRRGAYAASQTARIGELAARAGRPAPHLQP